MKIFRKLLILATSIVMGAAFVACGGGNEDTSSSSIAPESSVSSVEESSEEISSEEESSEEVSSEEISSEEVSSEEESSEEISSEEVSSEEESSEEISSEEVSSEDVSSEEISSEEVSSEEVSSEEVSSEEESSEEVSSEEVSSEEESSEEVSSEEISSEEVSSEEESSANEHTHEYKTFVAEPATCIADGVRVYNCDCGAHYSEVIPQTTEHCYNTWVRVSEPDCANAGSKKLVCDYHPDEVKEIAEIPARPHNYTVNNGTCSCGAGPVFPEAPATITYTPADQLPGTGGDYDRYEATEGYYTLTVKTGRIAATHWFSFAAPSAGQYALYTTSISSGVTITRYDASVQYITESSAQPATILDDGNLYGVVSCAEMYWSDQWRATFAITFPKNSTSTVSFRFVKIGEAGWIPSYTRVDVMPTQLNGNFAPEAKENEEALDVPYDTKYFYDKDCGFYRMGTKENPGAIIYAAITSTATRLFGDMTFQYVNGTGDNLLISDGYDVDGNYFARNYDKFINENYVIYCNSDGMYPVNQELYLFLNRYVGKNTPMVAPDAEYAANAWLAACFYYADIPEGIKENPIKLFGVGDFTANVPELEYVYYNIRYDDYNSTNGITYCIISSTDENAYAKIDGVSYEGAFSVQVETSIMTGVSFMIGTLDFTAGEITFTITVVPQEPVEEESTENESTEDNTDEEVTE